MNKPLKLIRIGNSAGVILPKEVLARLRVEVGDELWMSEAADGGYRVTPNNLEYADAMQAAEAIMREDREILRVLAQ